MVSFKVNDIEYNIISLTSVEIGNNINYSGSSDITIPSSVNDPNDGKNYKVINVSVNAFYKNIVLTNIDLSNCIYLTSLESGCFSKCINLTTIFFPLLCKRLIQTLFLLVLV